MEKATQTEPIPYNDNHCKKHDEHTKCNDTNQATHASVGQGYTPEKVFKPYVPYQSNKNFYKDRVWNEYHIA